MKNYNLLTFAVIGCISSHTHGMEQDLNFLLKEINARTKELQAQYKMGNYDKCDELTKEKSQLTKSLVNNLRSTIQNQDSITQQIAVTTKEIHVQNAMGNHDRRDELVKERNRLTESLMSTYHSKNEVCLLADNAKHITSSPETKQPLIIHTKNDPYNSLITVLHAKYTNENQYAAMTNYSLLNLIMKKESPKEQQSEIEKSCQLVLHDLAAYNLTAYNKIIAANFFLIMSDNSNDLEFCKEHISNIKNIITTKLENMCKIITVKYDHKNFEFGDIILTLYPDTAKLKIGNIALTDL